MLNRRDLLKKAPALGIAGGLLLAGTVQAEDKPVEDRDGLKNFLNKLSGPPNESCPKWDKKVVLITCDLAGGKRISETMWDSLEEVQQWAEDGDGRGCTNVKFININGVKLFHCTADAHIPSSCKIDVDQHRNLYYVLSEDLKNV